MLTTELKEYIYGTCGIPLVGIASADDLSAEDLHGHDNTNRIMAKYTPIYSADTPVLQPRDFLDNARALIVLGINMNFGTPVLPGTPPRGEILNFYVNPEVLAYVADKIGNATRFLTEKGYQCLSVSGGLPIKMFAARTALGRYGKNAVIQTESLGSLIGLSLLLTDAPLEPDTPLAGDCGSCDLCQKACPTGALHQPYACAMESCLTLHMVHNKQSLPYELREKAGTTIAHCNACLYVCPKNKNLPVQNEISCPEELSYPEIAQLVNMTDEQFQHMYGGSFLEYMLVDKKYLQRNAAVALGNLGDPASVSVLIEALERQQEEIVRGHAAWALGKIATLEAHEALKKAQAKEAAPSVRAEIEHALQMVRGTK